MFVERAEPYTKGCPSDRSLCERAAPRRKVEIVMLGMKGSNQPIGEAAESPDAIDKIWNLRHSSEVAGSGAATGRSGGESELNSSCPRETRTFRPFQR